MNDWRDFLKEVADALQFEKKTTDRDTICQHWQEVGKGPKCGQDACDIR